MDAVAVDGGRRRAARARDPFEEHGWARSTSASGAVAAPAYRLEQLLSELVGCLPFGRATAPAWTDVANLVTGSGSKIVIEVKPTPTAALLRPDSALAEIQASLSLNVTELAQILGVERPTIYAWISGRAHPQRANLDRLNWLRQMSAKWSQRSNAPLGELVRTPSNDGVTVVDLLSRADVAEADIVGRFAQAATVLATGGADRPRRGAAREIAARHGIPTPSAAAGQAQVDWVTRRSLGPEG